MENRNGGIEMKWCSYMEKRSADLMAEIEKAVKAKEKYLEDLEKAKAYIEKFRGTPEWKAGYFWFDREEYSLMAIGEVLFEFYKDVESLGGIGHPDAKNKVEEYEKKAEELGEKGYIVFRVKFKEE